MVHSKGKGLCMKCARLNRIIHFSLHVLWLPLRFKPPFTSSNARRWSPAAAVSNARPHRSSCFVALSTSSPEQMLITDISRLGFLGMYSCTAHRSPQPCGALKRKGLVNEMCAPESYHTFLSPCALAPSPIQDPLYQQHCSSMVPGRSGE